VVGFSDHLKRGNISTVGPDGKQLWEMHPNILAWAHENYEVDASVGLTYPPLRPFSIHPTLSRSACGACYTPPTSGHASRGIAVRGRGPGSGRNRRRAHLKRALPRGGDI
jgi:hypothetical protein